MWHEICDCVDLDNQSVCTIEFNDENENKLVHIYYVYKKVYFLKIGIWKYVGKYTKKQLKKFIKKYYDDEIKIKPRLYKESEIISD